MMKRISSAALAVLTALLLIIPFVACHGSKGLPAFAVPEAFDAGRDYEISFWAKNDTNKTQVEIYKKAISDFEALYPNIKVNLHLYTDYGRIYNDVITNISTGTTPNVCITYPDHIATYITGTNVVVPLDELIDDPEYGLGGSELRFDGPTREEIIPKFLAEGVVSGKQYALPFMRSTEACYINKTMLEEMGFTLPDILTWDFVWQVAEAAAEKDADGYYKANGQKVMLPFIYKSTDNMMIQMLKQRGAGYSTEEGEVLLFNDTTKEILFDIADHVSKNAFTTFKISSYPGNFLNAGQCVIGVDSTAGATWMGAKAAHQDISSDKLVDFEIAVRPVPQFDPEHPQMISQGPSVCVFNKRDPQEVLASWLFAQFLLTNGVQIPYSETEGYIPVTSKAQDSAEYREYLSLEGADDEHYSVKIQAAKLLLDNIDNTFITPVFNGSASLRDAAGSLIENVTKSVRRGEKVDEPYFEKLRAETISLYRLDQGDMGKSLGKKELGPLPGTAVALIAILCAVWIIIGAGYAYRKLSEWRKNRGGGKPEDTK